jgi:hypothetical protein
MKLKALVLAEVYNKTILYILISILVEVRDGG